MLESVRRFAQRLRTNLLTDYSGQLERMTVQRVVACWLHLQYADTCRAAVHSEDREDGTRRPKTKDCQVLNLV